MQSLTWLKVFCDVCCLYTHMSFEHCFANQSLQCLNSMQAIMLLFLLLNANQILGTMATSLGTC